MQYIRSLFKGNMICEVFGVAYKIQKKLLLFMPKAHKTTKSKKSPKESLTATPLAAPTKLDELDYQILWHLDFDARNSLTEIGSRVGISKQSLKYRIDRLKELNVLQNSYAIIDIHRLGLFTFRVYYRFSGVDKKTEAMILQQFIESESTLWVVSIEGIWDLEVVFVARNFIHFNQIFKELEFRIGKYIRRYNISSSPVSYQMRRDYLISPVRKEFVAAYYGFEPSGIQRDDVDYALLTELSTDCLQTNDELARKTGISNTAVARRIQSLEEDKIIRAYRHALNLEALGRTYVKALLYLTNLNAKTEKEIYNFCSKKSFVAYFTEVVGDWQLEVETEVYDARELSDLMKELRAAFPENVYDYQILRIEKEHKLNYLPTGNVTRQLAANG